MTARGAARRPGTGGQAASTAGEDREGPHFAPDVLAHGWGALSATEVGVLNERLPAVSGGVPSAAPSDTNPLLPQP